MNINYVEFYLWLLHELITIGHKTPSASLPASQPAVAKGRCSALTTDYGDCPVTMRWMIVRSTDNASLYWDKQFTVQMTRCINQCNCGWCIPSTYRLVATPSVQSPTGLFALDGDEQFTIADSGWLVISSHQYATMCFGQLIYVDKMHKWSPRYCRCCFWFCWLSMVRLMLSIK